MGIKRKNNLHLEIEGLGIALTAHTRGDHATLALKNHETEEEIELEQIETKLLTELLRQAADYLQEQMK